MYKTKVSRYYIEDGDKLIESCSPLVVVVLVAAAKLEETKFISEVKFILSAPFKGIKTPFLNKCQESIGIRFWIYS